MTDMHKLVPGKVDPEHFERLLEFTKMNSPSTVGALRAYLVENRPRSELVKNPAIEGDERISAALFSRKLSDLNKVHGKVSEIVKFYRKR